MNRHLQILSILAESDRPLSAQQVTKQAGIPRATGYKLLEDLVDDGWVRADGSPRHFRPSLRVAQLGLLTLRPIRARRVVLPHSIECTRALDKRCSVSFYEDGDVVYTDAFQRAGENVLPFPLHARVHCLTTASGRILLAFQPEVEIERVLCRAPLPPRMDGKETDPGQVMEDLKVMRTARYATADGEYDVRARGAACPVFNERGDIVAAMGVDAPSGVTSTFVEAVLGPLRTAAGRASLELGYMGDDGLLS